MFSFSFLFLFFFFFRPFTAHRGTSLGSWFLKKCFATPICGLSGHFASLVVSKKVPAIYGDFVFFSQNPPILKVEVGILSQFFFRKTAKCGKFSNFKLIMSQVSTNLRKIFYDQYPRFLKLEVGFFFGYNFFCNFFPK